jgi:serine/threonine protein kinase
METDLSQIIRSPQTLKDQHVQYFSFQLIDALNYLHSHNVIHRDLKPRNLLVNCDCLLKIADFGLARVYTESNNSKIVAMTEYVTTRWYRAPEILVGYHKYTAAVDMWAAGCIISEMISRVPMFPGSSSKKQLDAIIKIMGSPPRSFSLKSRKASYRQYLQQIQKIEPKHFPTIYPSATPESIDLIQRLLIFDPDERFTAKDALNHMYCILYVEYILYIYFLNKNLNIFIDF